MIAARKLPSYSTDAQRWTAMQARDTGADGQFVYGVRTTGVYCRPSSSTRLPKRENVEFFDTAKAAEEAGYRLSTSPDQTKTSAGHVALAIDACKRIEASEEMPTLGELAEAAGMSPFHFHRIFKEVVGVTPRAYATAHRATKIRSELSKADTSITRAIYDAGFNSNSRFYEAADKFLGMKAKDFKAGGVNAVIRFAVGESTLGSILVAQSERGICAILLGDDPHQLVQDLQDQFPKAQLVGGDRSFEALVAQVVGFVERPEFGLDLPLDVRGTAFQQRVWNALQKVKPGETVSYAELARRIGEPKAVRAVAQACASNRLAVAIPCHRVVRSDGAASGYRWGVERKCKLLDLEAGLLSVS